VYVRIRAYSTLLTVPSSAGMRLIERAGRRRLLLSSLAGVVVTLSILAFSFSLADETSPKAVPVDDAGLDSCSAGPLQCAGCLSTGCLFCLDQSVQPQQGWCLSADTRTQCSGIVDHVPVLEGCPSPYQHVLVGVIMAYLLAFSIGMGPVPWAVNAEIFPIEIRGLASGISGTANWLTNGVMSQTFLLLVHALRASGAFAVCASIAGLGFLWAAAFLPETKGLSLDEVQRLFWRRTHKGQPSSSSRAEAIAFVASADGVLESEMNAS
jgi:MFS transporter, SP family, solute carrier family 2 (myo-inositol transporter), member 13